MQCCHNFECLFEWVIDHFSWFEIGNINRCTTGLYCILCIVICDSSYQPVKSVCCLCRPLLSKQPWKTFLIQSTRHPTISNWRVLAKRKTWLFNSVLWTTSDWQISCNTSSRNTHRIVHIKTCSLYAVRSYQKKKMQSESLYGTKLKKR